MERKNLIILHIVGGLLVLIIGAALGFFYQIFMGAVPQKEVPKVEAIKMLSSKVIPSITAFGNVSKIEGKNVTLTFGGDTMIIKIRDNAQIFLPASSSKDSKGNTVTLPQQSARFADIKTGDNISINLKLLPDGQIEGQMVILLGNN